MLITWLAIRPKTVLICWWCLSRRSITLTYCTRTYVASKQYYTLIPYFLKLIRSPGMSVLRFTLTEKDSLGSCICLARHKQEFRLGLFPSRREYQTGYILKELHKKCYRRATFSVYFKSFLYSGKTLSLAPLGRPLPKMQLASSK